MRAFLRSLLFLSSLLDFGCDSSNEATPADAGMNPVDTGTAPIGDAMASETRTTADTMTTMGTVNPLQSVGNVNRVVTGYGFTEGTSWNAAGGFLLFSDISNNTIYKLVPPATVTVTRMPSGISNGLAWDPMGRLLAAEHGNRRVSRTNEGGVVISIAEKFEGKNLNSPNDVIARSDGNIYFTDPGYGLDNRPPGVTFKGVFRIDPLGTITVIDTTMNQPNGIALSPDETTLYVGDTGSPITNKWNIGADGAVGGKTMFVDSGSDGIGIDDSGNVYLTSDGQVKVFKADGSSWGAIDVPEGPTNCAFGGADRKTLYISAQKSIYSIELKVPGKP